MRRSAPMSRAWLVPLVLALSLVPLAAGAASNAKPPKPPPKSSVLESASPVLAPEDPGPKIQRSPAAERPPIQPMPGSTLEKQKAAPKGPLRPVRPGDGTVSTTPKRGDDARLDLPELKIPPKPRIGGSGFTPHPQIGGTTGKVFAPGGTIHLLGFHFGEQQGTVHLEVEGAHFPEHGDRIDLTVTRWLDGLVEAKIPMPMTGPLGRTAVRIHLKTADGLVSTYDADFDVPAERRVLRSYDPEVRLVACEDRADDDSCGSVGSGWGTIRGSHEQDWGMDVPLNGGDRWAIHLENGWVFSKMTKDVTITGDDGDRITIPDLPIGKTSWTPYITFKVTADDSVTYAIDIEVKRAKGAY